MQTQDTIKYLHTQKDDVEWVLEKTTTKKGRTLAQNRTFKKIFTWIGNYLGYTKEEVRTKILIALFWTYELKMLWSTHLIPNKTSTADLTKEEGILVIEWSLAYAKKIGAGIEITSREISSLYNTY